MVSSGTQKLLQSGKALDGVIAALRESIRRDNHGPGGDIEAPDVLWHELGYRRSLFGRAERDAGQIDQTFKRLCDSVEGPKRLHGTIVEIDNTNRTLRLDDGTLVALADAPFRGGFSEGSTVTVRGLGFDDGTVFGTDVTVGIEGPKPPKPDVVKCVFFRIAPAQSWLAPSFNAPPPNLILHEPEGYLVNGKLWLEAAMRIGVERNGCPRIPLSEGGGSRYSVEIRLTYKDTISNSQVTTLLAPDLTGSEAPVEFPASVDGSADATIVATSRVESCTVTTKTKIINGKKVTLKHLDCGPATTTATETYTARVRQPGGSYFTLKYDGVTMDNQTVYLDMEDSDFSSFRAVTLGGLELGLSHVLLDGTTFAPEAQGFLVAGGSSSKPNVTTIKAGTASPSIKRGGKSGRRIRSLVSRTDASRACATASHSGTPPHSPGSSRMSSRSAPPETPATTDCRGSRGCQSPLRRETTTRSATTAASSTLSTSQWSWARRSTPRAAAG